jgi:hypothetical protein
VINSLFVLELLFLVTFLEVNCVSNVDNSLETVDKLLELVDKSQKKVDILVKTVDKVLSEKI